MQCFDLECTRYVCSLGSIWMLKKCKHFFCEIIFHPLNHSLWVIPVVGMSEDIWPLKREEWDFLNGRGWFRSCTSQLGLVKSEMASLLLSTNPHRQNVGSSSGAGSGSPSPLLSSSVVFRVRSGLPLSLLQSRLNRYWLVHQCFYYNSRLELFNTRGLTVSM